MTCDRCRRSADSLTYVEDLRKCICASCLRAWKFLKKSTNNWGHDDADDA